MPFSRVSAMAWSMDGKGYVFGGRDSKNILHNDLWEYNPVTDSWQKICDSPLQARVNGVACTEDGKVYIGLGFHKGVYNPKSYLQDWWEYDPRSSTWTKLADYPNRNTVGPSVYVKDDKIYCVHGFGEIFTADVIYYDIHSKEWEMIDRTNRVDYICMAGSGATLYNRSFYGTGYNTRNLSDWYEIEFDGLWDRRAAVPGVRQMATCVVTDEYIYMVGGRKFGGSMSGGKIYDDVLRYDIQKDEWAYAGAINVPAEGAFSFSIDGVAYVGGGEGEEKVLNTLYKIED